MAAHCGHSNARAEYAIKEEELAPKLCPGIVDLPLLAGTLHGRRYTFFGFIGTTMVSLTENPNNPI